jgi:hypothetical protein
MDEWKLPWSGGCRCGQVRFEVTRPPFLSGACHCTGCQRMTGSAYSLNLSLPADGFSLTQGEPVVGGLHGPVSHHYHCPYCLSWLFTRAEGFDWFVNVRATMLDDPAWFEPFVELWTSEKLPWAETGAAHSFQTSPAMEEFQTLMEAYRANARRP